MTTRPTHSPKPHIAADSKARVAASRPIFPFTAIVGQDEMKLALLLNVVEPLVGGVLVLGHRGTGKSTAVRSLADLLPPIISSRGCAYNCDLSDVRSMCDDCRARLAAGEKLKSERRSVPVVELPLGATEDRVCGTVDIARALKDGVKAFEPGLLARANRGFLYIDEVNLLEDHLVDLLLDVSATGRNRVEREGVSAEHPSRFVLVGSGNPEEGELRPQLLDRFGLCAEVETVADIESRVRIVENREAFDRDPARFNDARRDEQAKLRRRIQKARRNSDSVRVSRALVRRIAELCQRLGVDGHRGEITIVRAARALAAFDGHVEVSSDDVRRVAPMSLRHRLRRDPLEQGGGSARVRAAVSELFGEAKAESSNGDSRQSEERRAGAGAKPQTLEREKREDAFERGDSKGQSCDSKRQRSARGVEPDGEATGARCESMQGAELRSPSIELGLRHDTIPTQGEAERRVHGAKSSARRRSSARKSVYAERGRFSGTVGVKNIGCGVAFDATMRVAASSQTNRSGSASRVFNVTPEDLRFKRLRGKAGALYIFAVDTSGSMAANRIGQAKGALAQLLRRSYVNRDRVSLVTFRGRGAELLLPPTGSAARARALLDALPVGGSTPLAAGLLRALEVARAASPESNRQINLVVFTDGRANVPLAENGTAEAEALKLKIKDEIGGIGAFLRKACVNSLVIDTRSRFTSNGEGRFLASALGGRYVRLPQLISEGAISEAMSKAESQ
ncbi:MAG TPA: magnesium chelatase ATPase subunit I [Pyrinomonadaceae bacterium]|nr:magnesium chelatase ATPase subunit I [Pyrinomonadaceae bacterium]